MAAGHAIAMRCRAGSLWWHSRNRGHLKKGQGTGIESYELETIRGHWSFLKKTSVHPNRG